MNMQLHEKNNDAALADAENEMVMEVSNLGISLGGQAVLKDINFHLNKKENLVVLGKSGSGKSVLIKCIVGLMRPDQGLINIFGKEILKLDHRELDEIRRRIGFLFQSAALYDSMSVKENLAFPMLRMKKKINKKELNDRIEEVLESVGLSDAIHKMPSELSGGMRKRIGLARTLVPGPEIMFYDEPTTGLDPVTSAEISELINEIREKYHTSSLIITHDMACAHTTSDRMLLLQDGAFHAEGTYDELSDSRDEEVQAFFVKQ
jgi:phospholipid/cholesterol/gamma-HCH transport system ATP-binding protein